MCKNENEAVKKQNFAKRYQKRSVTFLQKKKEKKVEWNAIFDNEWMMYFDSLSQIIIIHQHTLLALNHYKFYSIVSMWLLIKAEKHKKRSEDQWTHIAFFLAKKKQKYFVVDSERSEPCYSIALYTIYSSIPHLHFPLYTCYVYVNTFRNRKINDFLPFFIEWKEKSPFPWCTRAEHKRFHIPF